MSSGRAAQRGLCMRPLSQRDATVTGSLCQVSRNLSHQAAAGWSPTAGVFLWVGETGDLALEVTSHKICLQRKYNKAMKMTLKIIIYQKVLQGLC